MRVGSSSSVHGGVLFDFVPVLSWVFSPGFWSGFLPLPGVTAPVWSPGRFWLFRAGSRLASPLRSLAPSFSGVGAGGRQSPPCFLT